MELSVIEILIANLAVAAGGLVQGSVGLGSALVAAPILMLLNPGFVPGPMILCATVLSILMLLREKSSVDFFGLRISLVGRILGTPIGVAIVANVNRGQLSLVFGAFVVLAVGVSLLHRQFRMNTLNLMAAGLLSGIMGTTASIGGPPMGLIYQNAEGSILRATLSGFFTVGAGISLVALAAVGKFGRSELLAGLMILPGIIIGFMVSKYMVAKFDKGYTRYAVLIVSLFSGIVVILRELV